jgi:hypothetical protein
LVGSTGRAPKCHGERKYACFVSKAGSSSDSMICDVFNFSPNQGPHSR